MIPSRNRSFAMPTTTLALFSLCFCVSLGLPLGSCCLARAKHCGVWGSPEFLKQLHDQRYQVFQLRVACPPSPKHVQSRARIATEFESPFDSELLLRWPKFLEIVKIAPELPKSAKLGPEGAVPDWHRGSPAKAQHATRIFGAAWSKLDPELDKFGPLATIGPGSTKSDPNQPKLSSSTTNFGPRSTKLG